MNISRSNEILTCLGIDFGLKKVGISLGQTITCKARPLSILKNDEVFMKNIHLIIENWQPDVIIIGDPQTSNNVTLARELDKFSSSLESEYGSKIRIVKFSETLSTEEAKMLLKELRKNRILNKKKKQVDDISACLILESWFNDITKKKNGN
tara:strand:- start:479 stop:934 length:456 start_codon:yes stop_codon:yes gene_type:complete